MLKRANVTRKEFSITEKDFTNRIDGLINDYEGGVSEKDETIKSFAFFVGECAKNAVNNALTDYKQSIIDLINEAYNKVLEEKRNNYDHTEFYVSGLLDGKLTLLTELKGKIEAMQ